MRWISATHLVQWADTKDCESLFPELIRKLIIASCKTFPEISMPAGDSIYKPGWDGRCYTETAQGYVPQGLSLWELGRDEDFKSKCTRDFAKRTEETSVTVRETGTFVFATPRRWVKAPMKDDWVSAKKDESSWKDIKVYDADDLECWIEQHPAIGLWLARELKKQPASNVQSAYSFWQSFINTKSYTLTAEAIIAGRENERNAIQDFLTSEHGIKEVQGTSISEAVAFIIASEISKGESAAQDFFARALRVTDLEALRLITSQHQNLFIIYDAEKNEALTENDTQNNHVLVPVSYKVKSKGVTIPIPKAEAFMKSLEGVGLDWQRANALTREAGRSFSVLRRILSEAPGRVAWNEGHNVAELIPIFFVQRFDDGRAGDQEVVAKLARVSYENYKEKLKKWSLISDSPIYQVANHWRVVSSYDLLFVLGKYITEEHLKLFEEAVFQVLGEKDPALELEPKMRMAAAIFNKESHYSSKLKNGISQTLALLSVHAEEVGLNVDMNVQSWIDNIVRTLLGKYEVEFWQSIESRLHLLAEASPSSFLGALEGLIKQNPQTVAILFDDHEYDLFTPTYHTHILWALESLAWDPYYHSRVVMLLAELVELDKGGKLANRPINSLRHIFLLWLPQTYAPIISRNSLIDTLIKKKENIAFKLLKEIAPRSHDTRQHSHKPMWRLRDYNGTAVTREEWAEGISFVCNRLIQLSGNDVDRWIQLIELFDDFFGEDRTILIAAFTNVGFSADVPITLLDKLREFIQRHERNSDQDWALKSSELAKLQECYNSLVRNDIDRYYWYFNVDTIETRRASNLDYPELLQRTVNKRIEALSSIVNSLGFDGVQSLAMRVTQPFVVGSTLARIRKDKDQEMLNFLDHDNRKLRLMAKGYFNTIGEEQEFEWVGNFAGHIKQNFSDVTLTAFFLSINPTAVRWTLLKEVSVQAYETYWKNIFKEQWYPRMSLEDNNQCIRILNSFGRYATSLDIIRYERKETPPELIVETLLGLIIHPLEEDTRLNNATWLIVELFKRLDEEEVDEEMMQRLEWHYMHLFTDRHNGRPIRYLFKAIANDPSFFSELISMFYIPENNSPDEEIAGKNIDIVRKVAEDAHKLLEAWTDIPGQAASGEIDLQQLKQWIEQAIQECKAKDREKKAYYEIGNLFGRIKDKFPNWPMPEICELIEEYNHQDMNEGFFTGVINGTGTKAYFRPASGGEIERAKAAKYRELASKLSSQYPLVARLLGEVERYYESRGKHMDRDDAQRNLDY